MKKETVVKVANDLINQRADMSKWLELVSDYCEKKDKDKAPKVIGMFPSLPQEIQVQIIKKVIDYYCRELNIFSLEVFDNSSTFIINGIQQSQYKPIYYYI